MKKLFLQNNSEVVQKSFNKIYYLSSYLRDANLGLIG